MCTCCFGFIFFLPFMDAVKFRTIRNIAISFVISVQLETKLYRL